MSLPPEVLVHTVTVEPYEGTSSTGPLFGAPFALPCLRQGGVRMIRDVDGIERVASVTLYADEGEAVRVPAGSRITLDTGATTTALQSIPHDSGALGAPDHTEVVCE